ncbi:MAG: 50S ribosomal protein L4 [Bacilli bacterium]
MAKIVVLNQLGEEVKSINLDKDVFSTEPNSQMLCDVVNSQRAGMRHGTHSTKTATEVRGGGRKPYRQKGTGRARQGSINSPQYRGGGIVFGPTPHKYNLKVNKKVVQGCTRMLLTDRLNSNNIIVVDDFKLEDAKTKGFIQILNNIKADIDNKKILVITDELNWNLNLSGRNIPNVYVQTKNHLSVYDLLNANCYIMTEAAIKKYEEELK